jgi:ParB-like chromosome segregation protein Spo0J
LSPRPDPAATDWLRKQTKQIEEHDTLPVNEEIAAATQVEAWLQRRGVRYAPPTGIPMHMIDTKRSRQNQARRDPIVTESVERFAAAMKQNRMFPPIVVYAVGSKLIIIDGNNRHEAAYRAKREYIYGIVIDEATDSDIIQLLTVEANASHGVTPPLEWRIKQAFHLCSIGHDDMVAAEAAGITLSQLRNARAAAEADQRAKVLRIHGFADLPATSKMYLNGLKLEPVFHAAADLAAKEKLTIEQVAAMCRAVKTGKSEADQLAIVANQKTLLISENAAKKALTKRVNSPKNSLVAGIGLIMNCDPEALISQIRTVNDRDIILNRLQEMEDKLLELQVGLEKLKDMEE